MVYLSYSLMTLLGFSGLFLIGLILLQRGRGGGLAGAFGGIGGQSAFGTKAGDVFTRITIGVAAAWILLCAGSVVALHNSTVHLATGFADAEKLKADDATAEAARAERERTNARSKDADLRLEEPDNTPAVHFKTPVVEKGVGDEKPVEKKESAAEEPIEPKLESPAPEGEKKPEDPKL